MIATVALGATFLYFQAYEYHHAYAELNLKLSSGIYGSTFFMLTGFHGMHVTLGTIMLIIITLRLAFGHFKPESHFGFEGVAWYWHFVDVVWIGLFTFVYVL
jgi:cytochrome c oxidase subunit 3